MQLPLRTKPTFMMAGLMLLVVVCCPASSSRSCSLTGSPSKRTSVRSEIAHQVFEQAQRALTDAANEGLAAHLQQSEEIHEYVWQAFKIDEGLHSQLKAAKDTSYIYEVSPHRSRRNGSDLNRRIDAGKVPPASRPRSRS